MTGRGRGESKHVGKMVSGDPNLELQMETARQLGIPEGQVPIRGRGGFRREELRTIPPNTSVLSNRNFGGCGQAEIVTNFIGMSAMPNRLVHMYRVEFEPQIESVRTLRFLFRTAASQLFKTQPIYDGAFECRSSQELAEKKTSITVQDERDSAKASYTVTFTHTGRVSFGPETLRIYNMHMKDFLRTLGFFQPQTGVFVHEALSQQVNDELVMMRGFRTSAGMHDGGKMLMNLEASHKLMQRRNVLAVMGEIRRRQPSNLHEALKAELVGKLVVSAYDKRAYRIEDINMSMNPNSTFEKDGEQITFMEYYRRFKNVNIENTSQPLLLVVPNSQKRREEVQRELHLVPELCNIAGLTEQQRNDNRLKFNLIRASQVAPTDRVAQMRTFLDKFHGRAEIQSKLAEWGYSYDKDAVKLKAFVLPPTKIAYGDICKKADRREWQPSDSQTADVRVNGLAVSKQIPKMVIICTQNERRNFDLIENNLKQGFSQIGLRAGTVERVFKDGDRASDYISAIKGLPHDTTCAVVIMSRQNKERYDAIKKAATAERGLITQVVTSQLMTDQKKARSASTKIAIQIAAKVGGEPWWVDFPSALKSVMICGYDTYHDTAQRGRSFGAFLASMNDNFSRWWSKADSHDKLEELSSQVSGNMVEAVKQYSKNNNGELPQRIIIYRDGVGDGQLEHVFNIELKMIRQALNEVQGQKRIALTMIIVNKRIGARFYMCGRSEGHFDNPTPGTVIDHTVTRAERYDFYLISQSTRQGSITPTYYNIIHDESGFTPDVHQKMAFKMCLLYYNWAGTVRVPAPCQYAHKLALLCGEHLHRQPNAVLENRLHFL